MAPKRKSSNTNKSAFITPSPTHDNDSVQVVVPSAAVSANVTETTTPAAPLAPSNVVGPATVSSTPNSAAVQSSSQAEVGEAQTQSEFHYFSSVKAKVVGIQHYRGIVSKRERLVLEREPNNPYDKNAIMVKNSNGDKVGHIPRDIASFLSRYIDKNAMDVEAVTGSTAPGVYTLAITLHLFVTDSCTSDQQFRNSVRYMFPTMTRESDMIESGGDVSGSKLTRESFATQYSDLFTRLTAGEEGDPFSGLDLSSPSLRPTEAFKGTLLPYQQQGVAWMRFREEPRPVDFSHVVAGEGNGLTRRKSSVKIASANEDEVSARAEAGSAPKRTRSGASVKAKEKAAALEEAARKEREATAWFWKDNGNGEYTNVLTNFTTKVQPLMPRGGLLSDAMGLGKTVQMLAVICHKISVPAVTGGAAKTEYAPTLIVCPLSLLGHWEEHIQQFLPTFKAAVYHGPTRTAAMLKGADVVITTYATIASEGCPTVKTAPPLQAISWGRVILDEAHSIKSAKTNAAKACTSLRSAVRWCVTGTPLQNSLSDLHSLISFLHVEPFNDTKWWHSLLIRTMRARDPRGLERLRCLLRAIVLRRTKDSKGPDGKVILTLPPIDISDRLIPMTSDEKQLYERLKKFTKSRIEKMSAGPSQESSASTVYAEALVLLLRLRQLCNHPSLIPSEILSALMSSSASSSDKEGDFLERMKGASSDVLAAFAELLLVASDETCSICLEPVSNAVVTQCRHLFCHPCLNSYVQTLSDTTKSTSNRAETSATCPNCRGKLAIAMKYDDERVAGKENDSRQNSPSTASSKVRAVAEFVAEHLSLPLPDDDANPERPRKVVVFSQWPSMLAILSEHFSSGNLTVGTQAIPVKCVSLTGSLTAEQRKAAVSAFSTDPSVRVMLLSTMAGSVGLNLVSASACVLVDPWWNPSIDQQAIMRIHRIGQKRPVTVLRLAMEESVEVNIWDLQRKKQALFVWRRKWRRPNGINNS